MPYRHVPSAGIYLLNAACLQADLGASPELVNQAFSSRLTCLTDMCFLLAPIS